MTVLLCETPASALNGWAFYSHSVFVSYMILRPNRNSFLYKVNLTRFCNRVCFYSGRVVKALRYKPAGREFDSRSCHWNFSVT